MAFGDDVEDALIIPCLDDNDSSSDERPSRNDKPSPSCDADDDSSDDRPDRN